MITIAAASALLAAATPAHASGTTDVGPVGIGVIGTKLNVRQVSATLHGHEPGAKARVSLWRGRHYVKQVRGWKYASSISAGGAKFELVKWNMNRNFRQNDKLCVEFQHYRQMPCLKIHR